MSEIFIRRPIMTLLVMAGILLTGLLGFSKLPVSDLPNVDFPTIQVVANLPGASAETMASAMATPLEKQFSTIAAVDSMISTSSQGTTQVTLQFSLDRDIDAASQDVQSAIASAARQLPSDMPSPPSLRKVNPADSPVLFLAMSSDTLPLSTVDEYAQTMLGQRISTVPGVAQVNIFGSQKYAVRVRLDPNLLVARNIGIDEVEAAISGNNVNLPTGTLYGTERVYTVDTKGELVNAAAYRPLIVAYRNGSPVRLGELGTVEDSVENDKSAAWFKGKRGILLAIQRQPGANTIELVDKVKALLPQFRAQLPPGVTLDVMNDRSVMIRESVHEVEFTLLLALGLVVMVIFLFLRNAQATLIPSLALPMSLIGTFAVMYLCGFSLNNLSLMALTLCVGFVVDDAIVMLENITRHIEAGEEPMQAALRGAKEIGFTIVSMTISLAAVFIPVLFMGGVLGRLLNEFAVTIMVAVLVSGFVSLTLTPMLCSRMLKPHREEKHGRFYNAVENIFDAWRDGYGRSLQWVMRHGRITLVLFFVMTFGTGWLFSYMPKGFLPNDDTGQILAITEGAQDIGFDAMAEKQQEVARIIRESPYVDTSMAFLGSNSQSLNQGRIFTRLKPWGERPSSNEVIQHLRPQLQDIPGFKVFLQNVPVIRFGGSLGKAQYQFALQDADIAELYQWAPVLTEKIRTLPGFLDVSSDLQISLPKVLLDIDRDKASALGLTQEQIESALYGAYGSREVSTIYTSSNQYSVIMELKPEFQREPNALGMLQVRSSTGALVPLNAVASFTRSVGPMSVAHAGQLPAVNLSFNLKPGYALGDAISAFDKARAELNVPSTLTGSFQGAAQAFQASFSGIGLLLLSAVLVIYLVLGILYESFKHPVTILSGLPTAALGALLTLLLFKVELNIYAFVGMIMLIGIVKKNAIMMIDFALDAQRTRNMAPAEAIYQACIVRFRPIMMTTMAALFGTLPIALAIGAGGEARQPLGLAVVGGLIVSQFLTLYLTPVVYLAMESLGKRNRAAAPGQSLA